jgi:ribosomal-protein-alanine N-acetyltransferase
VTQAWTIGVITSLDDIDGVLAVEDASFTNPWTREMYVGELRQPDRSRIYAAREHQTGRITGFCSCWRVVDELHINNIAVMPEWRRQGIASALLTRALGDAAHQGARRATLEVRRSNAAAQRLYGRFGFSVAGVRHGYYTAPVEDALILWHERLADFA